jgi:hypothetical protein
MKASDHGYFAALTYDLRVRERLLAAGVVTQADIERYLTELPELETQADALGIGQPALVASASPPPPAPIVTSTSAPSTPVQAGAADGIDSSDDDDDDDEEGDT